MPLIADAQAMIEAHVGRPLESATHSELFDGYVVAVFLRNWPVTAISAITEDGTVLAATDYLFYPNGKVIRTSTTGTQILWRAYKPQSIQVDYTGGYLAGEDDLHDIALEHLGSICAEVVARAFMLGAKNAAVPVTAGAGGVQSVTLDGRGTITYATGGGESVTLEGGLGQFVFLNEDERRQLGRYRSIPLGFA
jgi:hypothetical protein